MVEERLSKGEGTVVQLFVDCSLPFLSHSFIQTRSWTVPFMLKWLTTEGANQLKERFRLPMEGPAR